MDESNRPFKSPSKKYHPKGLTILFEDRDLIVVDKSNGLLTVSTDRGNEKTAYSALNEYVKKGNSRSKERVYVVHRLDRDTSGVLMFAKSEKAKTHLQEHWANFSKTYLAVVHGIPSEKEGIIASYLLENKAYRMYSSKDESKGKFSKTGYKVVQSGRNFSLLEIALHTGRKNQIRVHLSEKGHPVVGDKAYGKGDKGIKGLALHAAKLKITHPHSKKDMVFEAPAPSYFKSLAKG